MFVSFRAPLLIVAEGATLPLAAGNDDDNRDVGGSGVLLGLPFGVRVVLSGLVPLALARRPSAAEVGRGEGGGAAAAATPAPATAPHTG